MAKAHKRLESKVLVNTVSMKNVDGQFIHLNKMGFLDWMNEQNFKRKIIRIQNHHTYKPDYTSFNGENQIRLCKNMKNYHVKKRKFSDIAQNITTFPDGSIVICRPFDVKPAGIRGANTGSLCIEHVGDFHNDDGDKMSNAHKQGILFLNAVLSHFFDIDINSDGFLYHHWFTSSGRRTNGIGSSAKPCPGINFFGGNKVPDAELNFYPEIQKALDNMREIKILV